jgi:hypothetical protein
MGLTSSPRRRRRLAWLIGLAAVVAVAAAVVVVLPRQGGSGAHTFTPATPQNQFGTTTTPNLAKEQAAGNASAKAVRPLATAFVTDVVHRRHLAQAHALLAPGLAAKYALSDWQAGQHLPVSVDPKTPHSVSTVLSFSGAKTAGFVSAVDGESPTALVAVRFGKQRGRWLVDYISQGHSSRLVDQSNFAPSGFLPGSYNQSKGDWLILLLGFLAVVAVVVLLDRLLGGGKPARA